MPFLANSSTSRGDSVSQSDTPPEAPLHGLRVLDLSRYFPGPLTGRELVRLGAFVIKVEVGSGDPAKFIQPMDGAWSVPYRLLNGGKAAFRLDLREDAGRLKFMTLAKRADVLIESFRPGRLGDMGLSPARRFWKQTPRWSSPASRASDKEINAVDTIWGFWLALVSWGSAARVVRYRRRRGSRLETSSVERIQH